MLLLLSLEDGLDAPDDPLKYYHSLDGAIQTITTINALK